MSVRTDHILAEIQTGHSQVQVGQINACANLPSSMFQNTTFRTYLRPNGDYKVFHVIIYTQCKCANHNEDLPITFVCSSEESGVQVP